MLISLRQAARARVCTPLPFCAGHASLQRRKATHRPPSCPPQVLRIPAKQTDAQLRALLEPYRDARLLHLSSTEGAFGKFEAAADAQRFQVGGCPAGFLAT